MAEKKVGPYLLLVAVLSAGIILPALACNMPGHIASIPTATPVVSPGKVPPAPGEIETSPPQVTQAVPPAASGVTGLKIVYTRDETLWLWAGGKARALVTGGKAYGPRISSDGRLVAFLRPADEFHLELWAVNIDGNQERRLVSIADLDQIGSAARDTNAVAITPYHYEWVPGTHSLAFNTNQVFNGPGLTLLNDLNLVDADSGKLTTLLPSGSGGEFVYSPDGGLVAVSLPDSISLANADGKNYRTVFQYSGVLTYSEYRYYARPAWSPESAYLRVAIPPSDPLAEPRQPTNLWKIPVEGSPAVKDGNLLAVPSLGGEETLVYSPDLARLAYLKEVGDPAANLRELWLATYDGKGGWMYIKAAMLRFLGWSPGGRRFIYTVGPDQEAWVGSLDTSPQPLKDAPGVMSARWVDDQQVVYVQQRVGAFELYLRPLEAEPVLLDSMTGAPPVFDFVR